VDQREAHWNELETLQRHFTALQQVLLIHASEQSRQAMPKREHEGENRPPGDKVHKRARTNPGGQCRVVHSPFVAMNRDGGQTKAVYSSSVTADHKRIVKISNKIDRELDF